MSTALGISSERSGLTPASCSCRSIARDSAIDGAVRPVLEAREQRRLDGIDAPRKHGRDAGQRRGEAAVEIGAAPRVHVHELGLPALQRAREPRQQRNVELAAHRQLDDARGRCRGAELAAWGAEQQILDAAARQPFGQIADLGRAAVEMSAGFDVRDSHRAIIRGAIALGSPLLLSCEALERRAPE